MTKCTSSDCSLIYVKSFLVQNTRISVLSSIFTKIARAVIHTCLACPFHRVNKVRRELLKPLFLLKGGGAPPFVLQNDVISKGDLVWMAFLPLSRYDYRVAHLLANLGWVDFDLGSSPGWWPPLGLPTAQAGRRNIPKSTQPRIDRRWANLYKWPPSPSPPPSKVWMFSLIAFSFRAKAGILVSPWSTFSGSHSCSRSAIWLGAILSLRRLRRKRGRREIHLRNNCTLQRK